MSDHRPRVFGIGLNKTATTSLHQALTILGYRSLHWGGPEIREQIEAAAEEGLPLLSHLDQTIDAFSDIVVLSRNFRLLDQQYPGSRYVLTVRPIEDWLDSREKHVKRNIERKAAGEYTGQFLTIDRAAWRAEWDEHVVEVREYFQGRDDFVEIDVTDGDPWPELCGLLGQPIPDEPFPWTNRHRG